MITLQVLGRLELRGADGGGLRSILAQPKRQALLAYLAVATPRGYHRRDTLVGLLWPESDEEHARASLSRAVSHLRQSLGADTIISRGHGELGIDWHALKCDAAEFDEALDRGDPAAATALYQGDLLPGFYLDETPAFEQWLERERSRLRGRAVHAAQQLSEREENNGQLGLSLQWARRAVDLAPLDEPAVRRLMLLLEKTADRAGALGTYEEFAARLRGELDANPAAETAALMATIRDRRQLASAAVAPPPTHTAAVPGPVVVTGSRRAATRWHLPARVAVAAAVIAVLLLGTWAISGRAGRSANSDADSPTVAVLPFTTPAGAAEPLGGAMVTLLSERLGHSGILRAVDARAVRSAASGSLAPLPRGADSARVLLARFRPRFVLLGQIETRQDSLRIDAALFDSLARQPVARAFAAGSPDDLARMAADLSRQLLEVRPTRREPFHDRSSSVLTQSVPALRAFLAGERQYDAGHYAEAATHFREAVAADSTFALAYLRLGRAANWTGDYALEMFATKRALDNVDRLTPGDQLLVKGWSAYLAGNAPEAERLARLFLVNTPEVPDAWYLLGEVRFHWGPMFGWTISEARDAYEHAYALSKTAGAVVHLARIAAAQGNATVVDSLARLGLTMGVDHPQSLELRGLRAYARGDRAEAARVRAAIDGLDDAAAFSVVTQIAVYSAEHAAAREVTSTLRGARRSEPTRFTGAALDGQLAMAHGRTAEVFRAVRAGADQSTARSLELRAAFAVMPFRRLPRAELAAMRDTLLRMPLSRLIDNNLPDTPDVISGVRHRYLLGMLAVRLGDLPAAERIAADLTAQSDERATFSYSRLALNLIRAEVQRAANHPEKALETLAPPRGLPYIPSVMEYMTAHERFLRAELNRDLGRWTEALRWYETFPDPAAYDLAYLAPAFAGKAAVQERLGAPGPARESYERAVALWRGADAEFAPALASVQARLAALR